VPVKFNGGETVAARGGDGMTSRVGVLTVLIAAILGCVSRTAAQPPAATAAPHPSMPWNQYSRPDYGQPIRHIEVPVQQMIIEVPVDVPAGVPPETQQQLVEIPGYVITETTTGYVIPERWTLVQTGLGVYQWQRVPGEFRRK
jgi:hypothetical protein